MENLWNVIERLYFEKFGIPEDVIEFVACEDVLSRCACGQSNYRIALGIKDNTQYVKDIITDFFLFDGWNVDLDFNPLAIYNRVNGNYLSFCQEIESISSLYYKYNLKFIFNLCKRFVFLKERRNKYYGDTS